MSGQFVFHLHLEILRKVVNVGWREARKRGHAVLRAAILDYRTDFLVLLVVQNHHRAHQARRLRPTGIFAVASGAVLFVKRLTQFSGGRVRRRAETEKLSRASARPSGSTPPAAPSPSALRRLRL